MAIPKYMNVYIICTHVDLQVQNFHTLSSRVYNFNAQIYFVYVGVYVPVLYTMRFS